VNAIKPFESIENKPTAKEVASYNEKIQSFISNWGKLLPGSTEVAKKLGFFDILSDSIDLMQDRLTSLLLEKHHPDMLISISRDAASTFEFFRAKELIEVGRVQFEKALKESQRISE
jgi:NTE family protein